MGTGLWTRGATRWRLGPTGAATVEEEGGVEEEEETATRSHEGHMVSVVGGFICM